MFSPASLQFAVCWWASSVQWVVRALSLKTAAEPTCFTYFLILVRQSALLFFLFFQAADIYFLKRVHFNVKQKYLYCIFFGLFWECKLFTYKTLELGVLSVMIINNALLIILLFSIISRTFTSTRVFSVALLLYISKDIKHFSFCDHIKKTVLKVMARPLPKESTPASFHPTSTPIYPNSSDRVWCLCGCWAERLVAY